MNPTPLSPDDAMLLTRVRREHPELDWRSLDIARLAGIARTSGIDYATALLYDAIRRSPAFVEDFAAIESNDLPPVDGVHLLLVPGAFHRHHSNTGADGRRIIAFAQSLGWSAEALEIGSLAPARENADAFLRTLLARPRKRNVVLVSLSKGSADVAVALRDERADEAFDRVRGWVSFSGLVHGTPLIDWLRRQRLRMLGVRLLLWIKGLRFDPLDELRHGSGTMLDAPVRWPGHVRAVQVVGFPLRRHLRHPWAPRGYERLSPLGPNDGGGILLGDVTRWPALVYPVWGADHYLQPMWDASAVLRNILLHAAMSHTTASAMPAARSTA